MRINCQVTERDFLVAQLLHNRARALYVWTPILAFGIWIALMRRSVPLALGFVVFLTYVGLIGPWRARRTFREYKALSEPFAMDVREDGLFFEREHSSGLIPWSDIVKWRATETIAMLYPAQNLFFVVPGHCFADPDEFRAFRDIVTERLGRAKW